MSSDPQPVQHEPVMAHEVLEHVRAERCRVFVDATVGQGGHALLIAERMRRDGVLFVVDARPENLSAALQRLASVSVRVIGATGNFRYLDELLLRHGLTEVDGVLYDQGLCMADYSAGLGFSFRVDEPLDMRRNGDAGASAADLLNRLSERELTRVFRTLGEERWSAAIARAIVERRGREPIRRTVQLARLVEETIPRKAWPPDIHPATRIFQALRYAVTGDLEAIAESIEKVVPMVRPGGRIVCLSFNSLEDRTVKRVFRSLERPCTCPKAMPVCSCGRTPLVQVITKRAVRPQPAEVERNPRARSAILRAAERVPSPSQEERR